jgi:hypothetical protein
MLRPHFVSVASSKDPLLLDDVKPDAPIVGDDQIENVGLGFPKKGVLDGDWSLHNGAEEF